MTATKGTQGAGQPEIALSHARISNPNPSPQDIDDIASACQYACLFGNSDADRLTDLASACQVKEWLTSLVGGAPFGILAFALDGNCILANQTAAHVLGTTVDHLVDRDASAALAGWPACRDLVVHALETGCTEFDDREVELHGRHYTLLGRSVPCGMAVVTQDVTPIVDSLRAQERLVDKLEHANRELEQFAYISAHDMKSPITSLAGLIEHLDAENGIRPEAEELFGLVRRSVGLLMRTSRALNDIMSFKRTLVRSAGTCDFHRVFEDAILSLADTVKGSGASVVAHCPGDPTVALEASHLHSILTNLIGNSIKYARPDHCATVEVHVQQHDAETTIRVTDNGRGFDAQRYGERVFGLFDRLEPEVEGSGVGLYIVDAIVRSYSGRIDVESEPGHGSTFHIALPRP